MTSQRPFASVRALFEAAERHWWTCTDSDRLEAFAAHPRIGETKASTTQNTQSAVWSKGEQSRAQDASSTVKEQLAAKNTEYFATFGFIYICFATGRTADEMLAWLEVRLARTRAEEIETAAAEQAKITRLRLDKWLDA
jgi:OHCU decarboxylase